MEVATPCLLPGPGKTILARFAIYDRVCVLWRARNRPEQKGKMKWRYMKWQYPIHRSLAWWRIHSFSPKTLYNSAVNKGRLRLYLVLCTRHNLSLSYIWWRPFIPLFRAELEFPAQRFY
jgi:hypothetical protein